MYKKLFFFGRKWLFSDAIWKNVGVAEGHSDELCSCDYIQVANLGSCHWKTYIISNSRRCGEILPQMSAFNERGIEKGTQTLRRSRALWMTPLMYHVSCCYLFANIKNFFFFHERESERFGSTNLNCQSLCTFVFNKKRDWLRASLYSCVWTFKLQCYKKTVL